MTCVRIYIYVSHGLLQSPVKVNHGPMLSLTYILEAPKPKSPNLRKETSPAYLSP